MLRGCLSGGRTRRCRALSVQRGGVADALHDDPDDIDRALQRHERQRLAYGRSLSAYGVALAHGALTAPGTR